MTDDMPRLNAATRTLLVQALRTAPAAYTWEQLASNLRKVAPTGQLAEAAIRRIRSAGKRNADLDWLCALARLPREQVGKIDRGVEVFPGAVDRPKVVRVAGSSTSVDKSQTVLASAVEIAVWRSTKRTLFLAQQHYHWPQDRGAMYNWVWYIVRAYTLLDVSSLLQRMKGKGLMRVRELGKVGSNQTLWTPQHVLHLRVRAGTPLPERLSDETLVAIIRRVLYTHRYDVCEWNGHVIIPATPESEA